MFLSRSQSGTHDCAHIVRVIFHSIHHDVLVLESVTTEWITSCAVLDDVAYSPLFICSVKLSVTLHSLRMCSTGYWGDFFYSIYLYLIPQSVHVQVGFLIGLVGTIITCINQFFTFCDRVERNIKYFKRICSNIWSFLKWPFCRIWFLFTWIWSLSNGLLYNKQTLIKKYRTVEMFDFPH